VRVSVDVRQALVRQWRVIAQAVPTLDLGVSSRLDGWRNREVLAHLSIQPKLLARFLETTSAAPAQVTLGANLSGTSAFAETIDRAARRARDRDLDFATSVERVVPALERADLAATVVTLQGPIALRDYLATRCVEAVVHGCDFTDPVTPDTEARDIACAALYEVMAARYPERLNDARLLPPTTWLRVATGRELPPPALQSCCPLMT
jgi:hypothetical protein